MTAAVVFGEVELAEYGRINLIWRILRPSRRESMAQRAILFRSSENEKQRARLCGGRIHVLGPSTDSDEPLHHEGSPLRTSAFSQGGHGTVLYVFGRPCTMVYAPGREYAFMEPRERWCVLFPITGRTHEEVVRLMYSDGPLTQGAPYGQDYSTPSD